MSEDIPRRRASYYLIGAFGSLLGASLFSFVRKRSDPDNMTESTADFLRSASGGQLLHSAQFMLDEYWNARLGGLCFWYQNFWELNRTAGALEAFVAECQRAEAEGRYHSELQRVRVLPAVARIHALATADPADSQSLSHHICSIHSAALDPDSEEASREVLESIWQNATAALIRNSTAWQASAFDITMIEEARKLLFVFLNDDPYILMPAVSAWQFLLTYEIALRTERSTPNSRLLHAIRSVIREVADHPVASRSYWFNQLVTMMRKRSKRSQMLPQMNEVLMFRRAGTAEYRDPVDFFTLVRLEQTHLRLRVRTREVKSPYVWPPRKASRTHTFMRDYGLRPENLSEWEDVRNVDPRLGPTALALAYWRDLLSKPLAEDKSADLAQQEVQHAEKLVGILPFNRVEAQNVMRLAYPGRSPLDELCDQIVAEVRKHSVERGVENAAKIIAPAFAAAFPVLRKVADDSSTVTPMSLEEDVAQRSITDLQYRILDFQTKNLTFLPAANANGVADDFDWGAIPPDRSLQSREPLPEIGVHFIVSDREAGDSLPPKEDDMPKPTPTEEEIEAAARVWYSKLQAELVSRHPGEFVVIDIANGTYVVAPSSREAVDTYDQLYPTTTSVVVHIGS